MNNNKGFTLIEILVVISIIVILFVIIYSGIKDHSWRKDNYCAVHGDTVVSTSMIKVGDSWVPRTITTTPCLEWRDKETEQRTYK